MKYILCLVSCLLLVLTACNKQGNQPGAQSAQDSTNAKNMADSISAVPSNLTDTTKVHLAFRFHAGDVMRYKEVSHTISEGKFNKVPSSANEEVSFYFVIKIAAMNSDGSFRAVMTYDSVSYTVQSDRGAMAFNTNDTTLKNDPRFAQWNYLMGVPVYITVSPDGDITQVDSLKPVIDRILTLQPPEQRKSMPAEFPDQLNQELAETNIKSVAGHVFFTMPGKELARDSSWSRQRDGAVDNIFPTVNTTTYTLKGYSTQGTKRLAQIDMALSMQVLKKQASDSTASVTLHNASVTGDGTASIDLYKGALISKSSRIVVSEDLTSIGRGQFAAGKGDISKKVTIETTVQAL